MSKYIRRFDSSADYYDYISGEDASIDYPIIVLCDELCEEVGIPYIEKHALNNFITVYCSGTNTKLYAIDGSTNEVTTYTIGHTEFLATGNNENRVLGSVSGEVITKIPYSPNTYYAWRYIYIDNTQWSGPNYYYVEDGEITDEKLFYKEWLEEHNLPNNTIPQNISGWPSSYTGPLTSNGLVLVYGIKLKPESKITIGWQFE